MPATQRDIKEFPLTYEKGLVTEIEASVLELGQVAVLENWDPTAQGGLRVRNTWDTISKTGLPTTYKVRGFGAIAIGVVSAAAATGPLIVQTGKWPDSTNQDSLSTKTITLTGCTIGNVLVAVVADDSGLTPTVTAGWTERAISTGNNQFVRFYTKPVTTSTNAFTYTITQTKIREVTVYEVANLDAEDPGTKWAAQFHNAGVGGSDSVTVNAVDPDGGLAIIGYCYNGGTPHTGDSGTAGMTSTSLDDSNPRTGVYFEDNDLLDGSVTGGTTAASRVYTSPLWTPPATGVIAIMVAGTMATSISTCTASGNGLTWNSDTIRVSGNMWALIIWADPSLTTPTTGAITVTANGSGLGAMFCSFFRCVGAPSSGVVVQGAALSAGASGTQQAPLTNNLAAGSGLLGFAFKGANNTNFTPQADPDDWESTTPNDTMSNTDPVLTGSMTVKFMKSDSVNTSSTDKSPDWTNGDTTPINMANWEIAGVGSAAQARHGTFTTSGTVTESFDYVANQNITAKMVVWGFTPPSVIADSSIQFYIVMALAIDDTTYKLYRILRDEITSGTWSLIDQVSDATSTLAWVAFAQGSGKLSWTSNTLTQPRSITLNPLGAANISTMVGKAGRCVAYHKDRLFIAGSKDNPSRLYFSAIGDPTSFTTLTDYLDIGGDDGEAIQDIISVEGLLLVCKTNRLYLVSGSGIETFFVNELPGGSAAPGRCVVRTPYGTIVAGTDDIWVVQGGAVDPMSRPLGAGYRVTGNVSTAYAQDSVLVADSVSGQVWKANLVTGAWKLEPTAPTNTPNPVYTVFSLNGRLYYGTNNSITQVGGTRQLSSSRNYDATTGGLVLRASTGRMSLLGPSYRYTPRFLWIQLRNQVPATPNEILVTVESDLGTEQHSIRVVSATQRERRDLGKHKGCEWLQVSYWCASSATAGAIDVEKSVLGVFSESYR